MSFTSIGSLLVLFAGSALAATEAEIDLKTQRFIGNVSQLDRAKYFNVHMISSENQVTLAELNYLRNDLNINFGRSFWSAFSVHSGNAPYPSTTSAINNGANSITATKNHPNFSQFSNNYIVTDHPNKVFVLNENPVLAARWAADHFAHYYDDITRPKYYEPMNEPFVHAGDFGTNQAVIRAQMTNYFAEIGKRFKQQGLSTKIIGYSSAWPSMEKWDFGHFEQRMKMFMDVAGPHIDSISFHPYDGVNVTGANNERSGSNLEALFDLVETYSQFKFNTVKPITISEYGGIEQGYGDRYTDLRSAQSVRSQNKMLMQLLNKQDRLLNSIPFNTGKAAWHYNAANNWNPYGATLLRPDPSSIVNGKPTRFFWTKRLDFYKLWSDVKGKRVKVSSSNPDIQIHAFVSGNKAYVAINSLADYNETVNLNFVGSLGNVVSVKRKRLRIWQNQEPSYEVGNVAVPNSHMFIPGETVVWEYTLSNPISFDATYTTSSHYAPEHLVAITANSAKVFSFNGLTIGDGQSVIRMGVSRAHGKSLNPSVSVNGSAVYAKTNWAGGNQATRDEFYGVIEIPVNNSILNANNSVSITFPDGGGKIASVVLALTNDTSGVNTVGVDSYAFANTVSTLPSQTTYEFAVDYSATAGRDVIVEIWEGNAWKGQGKRTVSAGSGVATVSVDLAAPPVVGTNNISLKGSIRPVGTGWQQNIDTQQINNIVIVTTPTAIVPPTGYTQLVNSSSTKCLDITAGGLANGVKIQQWQCFANNFNQQFLVQSRGNGLWSFKNRTSSSCIDKTNSSAAGAIIHQWTCNTNNVNQLFSLEPASNGSFLVKSQHSNLCLMTVNGTAGNANGTQITQAACSANNAAQRFTFQ